MEHARNVLQEAFRKLQEQTKDVMAALEAIDKAQNPVAEPAKPAEPAEPAEPAKPAVDLSVPAEDAQVTPIRAKRAPTKKKTEESGSFDPPF